MPGRNGYSTQGGWAEGGSNASGVPVSLTLDGRVDNQPPEYVASEQIEFVNGFASGDGDSFEAYITDGSSGSGNSGTGEYASGGYRYGFNGKENDNEIKGEGNQQDYGMRIYDPRLGRFLSVDALTRSYPWYTPYQFAGNTPIWALDIDGLEPGVRMPNTGWRELGNMITKWWNSANETSDRTAKAYQTQLTGSQINDGKQATNGDAVIWAFANGANAWASYQSMRGSVLTPEKSPTAAPRSSTEPIVVNEPIVPKTTTSNTSTPVVSANSQNSAANSGNPRAATANTAATTLKRPTPAQSEAELTPTGPGIIPQPKFKSGTLINLNTRGHVRPESYDFNLGQATEVKNFTFTPNGVNRSSINGLVNQIIQRQTHLPAGSTQHIIVDIRGQNVPLFQQMYFTNQVLTQTRTPGVSIEFKTK